MHKNCTHSIILANKCKQLFFLMEKCHTLQTVICLAARQPIPTVFFILFCFNCMHNKMRQSNNQQQLFNSLHNWNSAIWIVVCVRTPPLWHCTAMVEEYARVCVSVRETVRVWLHQSIWYTIQYHRYANTAAPTRYKKRYNYYKKRQRTHRI